MSKPDKTILILGGGIMQLPAVRIGKELNWRVIVADGNADTPGAGLADDFLHVDLKDREAMAKAASRLHRKGRLDGVFTAGTDFSTTVAWVAERLGLPGIPFEVAMRATDKSLMREAFERAGVPSPSFRMVRSPQELLDKLLDFPFPVVVKPVDNMGARGIRRIDNPETLSRAVERALGLSRSGKAIVEEFVEGPEYSIDAVVEQGVVTICGIADRTIQFPPYFVEMGHTMPTTCDPETVADLVDAFERGVAALGISNGAAKGDVKLSAKGPVIGEIAARLSGGYMSGWTYPYSSGVPATEAAMRIAVGLPAGELRPKWNMVSAERAFLSIPGVVARISGFEAARQLPSIKEGFLRVGRGDRVRFPTNNVEKCGNFISQADCHTSAVSSAEEACRTTLVVLEPGDYETEAFLFHGSEAWAPSAYQIEGSPLVERLMKLPKLLVNRRVHFPKISVLPFAGIETSEVLDWHGRSVTRTLEQFQSATGVAIDTSGDVVLGSLFWRALVRGGVQGAIWVIDTLRFAGSEQIEHLSTRWNS